MLSRLKRSRLGKGLYRVSRSRAAGFPLRLLARMVQAEVLHPSHFHPTNWRHNARQTRTLARYSGPELGKS